jgi:hypothetical protein
MIACSSDRPAKRREGNGKLMQLREALRRIEKGNAR